ncbi:MAG: ABC transporter permease subunit [Chloroflexi bacterium]|nr:ABC transporter permease subunit [Chloroflexota bacterium]
MIGRVLVRALWGYRVSLLFIAAGILAFETLIALIWRSLGAETALAFFDVMPSDMKDLMERQFGFVPTGSLAGWLAGLNRHPIYLVLLASFAIGTGAAAVAREIERGSILLVLARPLARWEFLLGKILATMVGLLVLTAIAVAGVAAGALAVGEPLQMGPFLLVAANGYLLFLTAAGVALLLSALGSDASGVAGQAAGVTLAAYFVDFLANLWSKAEFLGPLSFFHYYDPARIVRTGTAPWEHMAVLLAASLALHAAALVVFQRRDIAR